MDGGGSLNDREGGRKWVWFKGEARGIPVGTGIVSVLLVYIVYIALEFCKVLLAKGETGFFCVISQSCV